MSGPPPSSGYNFTKTLHNDIYPVIDPSKSDLSQPGKVVLITGAGRGLGRSIALKYAESGVASIIICARTASELDKVEAELKKTNSSVRVRKHTVDVSNEKSVVFLADTVKAEEGRLDVLINNAGYTPAWVPILQGNASDYLKTFNVNVDGAYLMIKFFLPLLLETARREAKVVDIVNMSSVGANMVVPIASAYQISKAAVSRLTEFVDAGYGQQGINCISLGPGAVLTEMSKDVEMIQPYLIDTPELCGGFMVWLTKEPKTWLGGRYVSVTWDVTELESMKDEIVAEDKLKQKLVL